MENLKKDEDVHYKVLAEMAGEFKMEALDVLQMGQDKFNELEKTAPILFRYVRALRPVFEGKKTVPKWVYKLYETHKSVKKYLEDFSKLAKGVHKLPSQGWYFSIEFIDAFPYEDPVALMEQDLQLFEVETLETFRRQSGTIQKKLLDGHPRRTKQIDAIFRLHAAGEYVATIPLALAQADGMCKDNFTIGHKGKIVPVGFFAAFPPAAVTGASGQKLSKAFNLSETSVFNVLCNQLAANDRKASIVLEGNNTRPSDLNRNAILHGESVDYDTAINSVKAILLLDFIEDLRLVNQTIRERQQAGEKP
jgi:hypothetical protein